MTNNVQKGIEKQDLKNNESDYSKAEFEGN
jgi:hypothetical protein